jgi:predicted kinase
MFPLNLIECGLITDYGLVAEMPYNQQQVIILVGNIGTGKTTWTKKYLKKYDLTKSYRNFVAIDDDSISTMISGLGKYDWIDERKDLYSELKKIILKTCLKRGLSVIIDGIHATRKHRKVYIDIAKEYEAEVTIMDFGCGDTESLRRRCKDNRGLPSKRWRMVHNFYNDIYEKPEFDLEDVHYIIRDPYKLYKFRRK